MERYIYPHGNLIEGKELKPVEVKGTIGDLADLLLKSLARKGDLAHS